MVTVSVLEGLRIGIETKQRHEHIKFSHGHLHSLKVLFFKGRINSNNS